MKRIIFLFVTITICYTSWAQNADFKAGEQLASSGNYQGAVDAYTKALAADPEDLNALLRRGFAYGILKEYEKAVADYSKVIAANDKATLAYLSRGSSYNKLKKYDLAIADFNKVLELDASNQEAYNNRGWAKKYLGQKAEACADWKASKKLGNAEAKLILKNNQCK